MLHLSTHKLTPSRSEFVLAGFGAVIVSIVGNGQLLLLHYGLISSVQTIGAGANDRLTTGLAKLDTYRATTTIVTFIVWAIIGLVTLSLVQALLHVLQQVSYRNQVSSNAYVHPKGFSRKTFWKQLFFQSIGSFTAIIISSVYIALFCLFALPLGLLYAQVFWVSLRPLDAGYALLGIAVLFVAILLLDICFRLVKYRYELTHQ